MQEEEEPKTRTDRILRNLKDHPVFALLIAAGTLVAALAAIADPVLRWRNSLITLPAPILTATVDSGGACTANFWNPPLPAPIALIKPEPSSPAAKQWARVKVTINNQEGRPRVLTRITLEPIWISYVSTLGLAEVAYETDVSLKTWAEAGSEVGLSLMLRDALPRVGAQGFVEYDLAVEGGARIGHHTAEYFIADPLWVWFRPQPLDTSNSLLGRYVAEPTTAEQVIFNLGGIQPNEFLAGTLRIRTAFDDGSESVSNAIWFELCPMKA